MTYGEYKPKWLEEKIFVDTYGRDYNLSDVPMPYMSREDAYQKRGYDDKQISIKSMSTRIDLGKIFLKTKSIELTSVHIHSDINESNQISDIQISGKEL